MYYLIASLTFIINILLYTKARLLLSRQDSFKLFFCMCIIQPVYLKFIHVDLSHLVYKMYSQFRVRTCTCTCISVHVCVHCTFSCAYAPDELHVSSTELHVHVHITFLELIHKCIPTLLRVPRGTYMCTYIHVACEQSHVVHKGS